MASISLKQLRGFELEKVRVTAEHAFHDALQQYPKFRSTFVEPFDPEKSRRQLLARALRLTDAMAPEVCDLARELERALGLPKPVELYQTSGLNLGMSDEGNATVHHLDRVLAIEVIGRWILTLDPRTMAAVLGHEIGHDLAHDPRSPLGTTLRRCRFIYAPDFHANLARGFRLATELTADRFGLLACQDLDAALRLEMVSTTGLPESALSWDTRAYLEQARELMEQTLSQGEQAEGSSHPEHSLRAFAVWLFSESDVYLEMTGDERQGEARPIAEVNATLSRLLGVPRRARFGGRPEPGPEQERRPPPPGASPPGGGPPGTERPRVKPPRGFEQPVYPREAGETVRELGRKSEEAIGKAARVLGQAAKGVKPGLSRASEKAGEGVARLLGRKYHGASSPSVALDEDIDPLRDDEDELLDRFARLESTMTSGGVTDLDADSDVDDLKQRFARLEQQPKRPPRDAVDDDDDDEELLARIAELEKQMK